MKFGARLELLTTTNPPNSNVAPLAGKVTALSVFQGHSYPMWGSQILEHAESRFMMAPSIRNAVLMDTMRQRGIKKCPDPIFYYNLRINRNGG